jgi:phospholipid/cholesterol/gamma-HCH transport system permease protein
MIDTTYNRLRGFGEKARYVAEYAGGVASLAAATVRLALRRPLGLRDAVYQIEAIGINSLSIVVLTAVFSSMVMTVQFAVQMARFGAKEYVGNVVSLSLVRELGPVLTALMVGGRVGAGIAAEIGSMNVTEQVDAMRSMGADPVKRLVVPRVVAGVVALPLLTVLANVLGVAGAMVIASVSQQVNMTYFYNSTIHAVELSDLLGGLAKTVFFGFSITLIACYQGLSTRGGTEGVGRATTQTVVITSIVTLISDFILTNLLLEFGL